MVFEMQKLDLKTPKLLSPAFCLQGLGWISHKSLKSQPSLDGGLSIVKPTINMTILFKVKSRPKTIGEILADSDDDGDMEMAGGDENNPGDANSR